MSTVTTSPVAHHVAHPAGAPSLRERLDLGREQALRAAAPLRLGRVSETVGLHLRVVGLRGAVGDLLEVRP
ncbi:hypothetical protein, partial [Nocardioides kribbensis]|uniref:hypothetical protein n=1 Tax=Nocardioides kribbensis TaxID=305517 RepID=UPI0032D9B142